MTPLGLTPKIILAVIGLEECPDGPISIERDECAALPVESGSRAVSPNNFLNRSAGRPVPKLLRFPQIFLLRDPAEFATMLRKVIVELLA